MSQIAVTIDGSAVPDWGDYEVAIDLRQPASTFSLSGPFTAERYRLCRLGAEVSLTIDGHPVISGYITGRRTGDASLSIDGHDRVWRMTLASAPLRRIRNDSIESLARTLTEGIFGRVVFSNAANRALYGGSNRKIGREPPVFSGARRDPVKVPLGASLWTALSEILRRAELLAWSSADGHDFVIARPNFSQEPRYRFEVREKAASTCADILVTESIAQRVQTIEVLGSARTPSDSPASYGVNAKRSASATDPDYPLAITRRLVEEVHSVEDARVLAQATLDELRSDGFLVTVEAWGHGQEGRLYAVDTVADVVDERRGLSMRGYVAAVSYRGSRTSEAATLEIVPLHTRLVIP